jgi:hypothetical protein
MLQDAGKLPQPQFCDPHLVSLPAHNAGPLAEPASSRVMVSPVSWAVYSIAAPGEWLATRGQDAPIVKRARLIAAGQGDGLTVKSWNI